VLVVNTTPRLIEIFVVIVPEEHFQLSVVYPVRNVLVVHSLQVHINLVQSVLQEALLDPGRKEIVPLALQEVLWIVGVKLSVVYVNLDVFRLRVHSVVPNVHWVKTPLQDSVQHRVHNVVLDIIVPQVCHLVLNVHLGLTLPLLGNQLVLNVYPVHTPQEMLLRLLFDVLDVLLVIINHFLEALLVQSVQLGLISMFQVQLHVLTALLVNLRLTQGNQHVNPVRRVIIQSPQGRRHAYHVRLVVSVLVRDA